ncbi:hypothetical protein A6A06_38650 [Streptomyces sp. CB02923]|uniref:hypothetical protein n=1 Tax=Streptomyces sp. CB02923 TaxID=1718985 RepID=UPI00093E9C8D|nr:hypothetical protein [Streptomyces sp. CB02923]OKI04024.1 hypothetical protein A6A06_38650 [Streptomyces sp. CB02923]
MTPGLASPLCFVFITSAGAAGILTGAGRIAVDVCHGQEKKRGELNEQMHLLSEDVRTTPATDALSRPWATRQEIRSVVRRPFIHCSQARGEACALS